MIMGVFAGGSTPVGDIMYEGPEDGNDTGYRNELGGDEDRRRRRLLVGTSFVPFATWRYISMSKGTDEPDRSSHSRMVSGEEVGVVTRRI